MHQLTLKSEVIDGCDDARPLVMHVIWLLSAWSCSQHQTHACQLGILLAVSDKARPVQRAAEKHSAGWIQFVHVGYSSVSHPC
jgi:hypothetical protein